MKKANDQLRSQNESILRLATYGFSSERGFERFTEEASATLDLERASIWLIDNEKIRCVESYDAPGRRHEAAMEFAAGDFPDYIKLILGGLPIVHETAADSIVRPQPQKWQMEGRASACLEIPFKTEGNLAGVFRLERDGNEHKFALDEINYAMAVTEKILRIYEHAERKQYINALGALATSVATSGGDDFFRQITCYLTKTLQMEYALIGEFEAGKKLVKVISLARRGEPSEPFIYELKGTPCEQVNSSMGICAYPANVAELFPNDLMLAQMGIQSYIGAPIWRKERELIGLLVMLDTKPMANRDIAVSTLMVYAERISSELARRKYESLLLEAKEKAETANLAKTRFLSMMSHELRTPLNAILGYSDLLRQNYYGPLNNDQRDFAKRINEGGEHLLKLIDDILDISRIDEGAMGLQINPRRPLEVVNMAVELVENEARKKNLSIEKIINAEVKAVMVDLVRAQQILINLLFNAVKYTPPGGSITIAVSRLNDSFAKISVRDTGIGIEASKMENLFLRFYQVDRERDEHLGGAGLGLALARQLTELQGGQIGVESQVGQGSDFWFTIPLADERLLESGVKYTGQDSPAMGRRILVAEDDDLSLELIIKMLGVHKHEVTVARNGREAVALAEATSPELILMDIKMPVMDGIEAVRIIRSNRKFARTPILAMTASTGLAAIEKQANSGCDDHISKPIHMDHLLALLKKHLNPALWKG
ncbi:MAG: ATP-binding protein [Nitrospinota bacterium]|nr:ATP-binding protein [Nitrospinota bacterium]